MSLEEMLVLYFCIAVGVFVYIFLRVRKDPEDFLAAVIIVSALIGIFFGPIILIILFIYITTIPSLRRIERKFGRKK